MKNKISAQIQERNDLISMKSHQLLAVYLEALVSEKKKNGINSFFSDISHQNIIKTWTSDRLAEVQGATKVTVQGKE